MREAERIAATRSPTPLRGADQSRPRRRPPGNPARGGRPRSASSSSRGRWKRRYRGRRRGGGAATPDSPPRRRRGRPAPRGNSSGLRSCPRKWERSAARRPSTAEELLHPIDEGRAQRSRGFHGGVAEVLEQITLAIRELLRHLEHDLVEGVAVAASAQMRQALALEDEMLAGLGARRHREPRLAAEDGHLDLVAEADLGVGQGQCADNVVAMALEHLVRADLHDHVEITGRRALEPALAFSGETELVAIGDARRNGHGEQALPRNPPLAAAGAARTAIDGARPAARGARTRHREEALGEPHLPLATTRAAGLRPRAFLLAGAAAALARLVTRNLELALDALGCLLQRDLQAILQVVAAAHPAAPPASAAEEALEEILEDGAEARAAAQVGHCTKAIVLGALVGIGEHGVGLADLLEALLGARVAGILVRMVLTSEGAVGLLQRGVVGVAGDAEDLVVVLGRHAMRRRCPAAQPP